MNKEKVIHVRLSDGAYNDLVCMMIEMGFDVNVSAFVRMIIKKEVDNFFNEKK